MVYVCYVIYELVTKQCQMMNVLVDSQSLKGQPFGVPTPLNLFFSYPLMNFHVFMFRA